MIEKRIVTGSAAFSYLHKQLESGRSLSSYVNLIPLESGDVYSIVPEGVADDRLYAFNEGGIYPSVFTQLENGQFVEPISNESMPYMIEEIWQNLLDVHNMCLFEEPILYPDQVEEDIDYVYIGKEQVFYFFNHFKNEREQLEEAILTSENYIFLCALSKLDESEQQRFQHKAEIEEKVIEEFAKNVFVFFSKAYDGEGYLMWVRH